MNLDTPAATVATRIEPAADPGLAATLHAGPAAADGLTFLRGSLVGRYVVLERIGAGAMGVVFAAYDPELDRKVALKFLRADNADPEARTRLLREAQAMARLAHPNVVAVHDVGTFGGEVFVAMEFVQGVTLRHWLAGPPRGWRETVAVFVAAGRGLAAAHEAGLVHRDLKPENIMIGADERVRVMDFGLARASGRDDGEPPSDTPSREQALALELTRTGALVGTPAYMAPEQWERQESDARSDQFSFCVALWEALYGERPFRGETLAALMLAVTEGRPRAPGDPRRAPGWARRLLERGLSTDPAARWPSMAALLAELTQDRRTALRRWSAASVGIVALLAAGLGAQQVLEKRAAADAERERAERAETDATAAHARAEREAFERTTLAEAQRSGEVLRLATTGGRERDALVLGVQVLAPFGPTFDDAPPAALEGLSRALPALIPVFTRSTGDRIRHLLISPDGDKLVVVGQSTIQVWSSQTGELVRSFSVDDDIEGATLSRDGSLLAASGSRAGIWDLASGRRRLSLGRCRSLEFSANGATVFGIVEEGPLSPFWDRVPTAITAWDSATGTPRWSLPIHGRSFERVKIFAHPVREQLVVKLDDAAVERVLTLDGETGRQQGRLAWPALKSRDRVAALSGSGRLLISAEFAHDTIENGLMGDRRETRVLFWELDARRVFASRGAFPVAPSSIVISPDDREVVVKGSDRRDKSFESVRMHFDAGEHKLLRSDNGDLSVIGRNILGLDERGVLSIRDPSGGPPHVAQPLVGKPPLLVPSPHGDRLAFAAYDTFGIWSLPDPVALNRWSAPTGERVQIVSPSIVSTRDTQGNWRLYAGDSYAPIATIQEGREDGSLAVDDDWRRLDEVGGWIETRPGPGRASERARYIDAKQGRVLLDVKDYEGHRYWLSRSGSVALDLGHTPWPEIVDPRRAHPSRCFLSREGDDPWLINSFAGSADLSVVLQSAPNGVAGLWSAETCEKVWAFRIPMTWDQPLSLDLLGVEHLLIGDEFVIDTLTGEEKFRLDDKCWQQTRASPNGDFLFSWCAYSDIGTLWDVTSGVSVGEFDSAMGFMAIFTDLGDRMGIPTREGGFRVIDTHDGTEVVHIRSRLGVAAGTRVTFTPDGEAIRLKGKDGAVYTYPASRAGLIRAACKALAVTDAWAEVSTECSTFEVIAGGD